VRDDCRGFGDWQRFENCNVALAESAITGQATKIIFPFEVSRLIKQGAKFLGDPDESLEEPSKIVLDDSILGNIPRREEVDAILKEIQDAVPKVSAVNSRIPASAGYPSTKKRTIRYRVLPEPNSFQIFFPIANVRQTDNRIIGKYASLAFLVFHRFPEHCRMVFTLYATTPG
jgi:hypothetical protein